LFPGGVDKEIVPRVAYLKPGSVAQRSVYFFLRYINRFVSDLFLKPTWPSNCSSVKRSYLQHVGCLKMLYCVWNILKTTILPIWWYYERQIIY